MLEALKALRAAPPTPAELLLLRQVARRAHLSLAAAQGLEEALPAAPAALEALLHRHLAWLHRHEGKLEEARLHLYQRLADAPGSQRDLIALSWVLGREGRAQEREQVLGRLAREWTQRGPPQRAARAHLERGRLLAQDLHDLSRASLAFGQAAARFHAAQRPEDATAARALSLWGLVQAQAPTQAIAEAVRLLVQEGRAQGREPEAQRVAQGIERGGDAAAGKLAALGAAAEKRRSHRVAIAIWEAASECEPGSVTWPEQLVRLFTHLQSWAELAEHYRRCAARSANAELLAMRANWLTKRAQLLEDRLGDPHGAAQAFGEAFAVLGEPDALRAQLRLIHARHGAAGAEAALDRAVSTAQTSPAKATALRVRARLLADARRFGAAASDLSRALSLAALDPDSAQLWVECRAEEGDRAAVEQLWTAGEGLPRGAAKAARFRRLARLCLWPLNDTDRALLAWRRVLESAPGDAEAEDKLSQAAHVQHKPDELVALLRARIQRAGRGPEARAARHELAQALQKQGLADEAFTAWQEAARAEPSDAQAQLALADGYAARGKPEEAALALENAAQGLDEPGAQAQVWERLAAFYRDVLQAPERAVAAERRARMAGQPSRARPRSLVPADLARPAESTQRLPELPGASPFPFLASVVTPVPGPLELPDAVAQVSLSSGPEPTATPTRKPRVPRKATPVPDGEPPRESTRTSRSRPGTRTEPRRRRSRTGAVPVSPAVSFVPLIRAAPAELLVAMEANPLDPMVHFELADHFDGAGDVLRSTLFIEVGQALQGDPDAEPLTPKGTLSAADQASLRHRDLKGPAIDALVLVGEALCAQAAGRARGEPFAMNAGRGAPAVAQSLLDCVRLLGQRAPDVVVGSNEGPPVELQHAEPVRLSVGRLAIRKELSAAELRFHVGRELTSLSPELCALRLLTPAQLTSGLQRAAQALLPDKLPSSAAQALKDLRERVGAKRRVRFLELVQPLADTPLDWGPLVLAGRLSAYRVGMVTCGGVAPALRALISLKAPPEERADLVRFAISDRMVTYRARR
jgi:hypothetical protein